MPKKKTPMDDARKLLNVDPNMIYNKMMGLGSQNDDGTIMVADPGFERNGTKIILPELPQPMPIIEAVGALLRYMEEEETEMSVLELIEAFPQDAAVAFNEAVKRTYGWANSVPTPGFWGPTPPSMITVKTGPRREDFVQVPWGSFQIPGIENRIELDAGMNPNGAYMTIQGSVKKRERSVLVNLANLTRAILEERSIYRGKAIQLTPSPEGRLSYLTEPTFFDVGGDSDLILNQDELGHIQAALWAPIEYTDECLKQQIPLKRGVLLEGTYGTGKTLTARKTAQVCVRNGWTFIMLDDVRALKEALVFARRYQPAVVFAEDIDRLISDRDQAGNDLLNTIDGVLSKNSKVITVLTTNHVEKINRAMLRPGRLDAVISIRPPEAEAVKRLITLYGRGLIAPGETMERAGEVLAGHIPATIREVVERSKLSMIFNERESITEQDILTAAHGMQSHLDLLKDQPKAKTPEEILGDAMGQVVRKANGLDEMEETVEKVDRNIRKLGTRLSVDM